MIFRNLFKRRQRGYIILILCIFIPIICFGTKWCLDKITLDKLKINIGDGREDIVESDPFKKCAKEAALAVAKKWNPALSYNDQKISMLRIADEIYNASDAFIISTLVSGSPLRRAIPTLDIDTKVSVKKRKGFDPTIVTLSKDDSLCPVGDEQKFTGNRIVEYINDSEQHIRGCIWNGSTVYRQAYYLKKNPAATLEVPFCDVIPQVTYYNKGSKSSHNTAEQKRTDYPSMQCSIICDKFYADDASEASHDPEGIDKIPEHYRIRKDADDPKVQISVVDDKIMVKTDADSKGEHEETIGYATPAECNVDIVLTIPTNAAACNYNNRDINSPTAETPTIPGVGDGYGSNTFKNMKKTPIYQIAQAYRVFLHENFEFTRGVNVGVIPYSGKVSLPPERAEDENDCWTEEFESFTWDDDAEPYIRPLFLYGISAPDYSWPGSSSVPAWGGYGDYGLFPVGGYGIMCRGQHKDTYAGNKIYMGDLLSTADPKGYKFKRVNFCPTRVKNVSIFANNFPADPQYSSGSKYPTDGSLLNGANPYFIVELNPDVTKICDLLNAVVPFEDNNNVSNFIFIPITWANNLFQTWARHDSFEAMDSEDDNEGGGHLSHSATGSNRKKALILIVNKPDWFEPDELTYIGFDNDYSEVPMIESDSIDFSVNYSDNSRKFADGTAYNGTIQGQNKILQFSPSGVNYSSKSGYYECADGSVTLKFPRKALVKVVAGPIPGMVLNEYANVTSDRVGLDLYYANGNFIQIKKDTETDKYRIWKSSDMQNWEDVCDAPLEGYDAIIYSGDKYISYNFANTPKYVTSSDLENWSPVQTIPNFSTGPSTIRYWSYGDKIYVTSAGNNNLLVTENGGTSWKALTKGWRDDQDINSLIVIGETIMAYAYDYRSSDKCLFTSYDGGNSWVESSISHTPYDCVCVNGKFWGSYNGKLYTSSDGKTWEENPFPEENNITVSQIIAADDKIVITGSDGKVYSASESNSSGTIKFSKIKDGNLTNTEEKSITGRTEFYIEPNQITQTNDGCEVKIDLKNIRLISAEITNRPYEIKTTTETVIVPKEVLKKANISLSGTTRGTGTGKVIAEAQADIKLTVDPMVTLEEVGNVLNSSFGGPLFYANGKYFCFNLPSLGPGATWADPANRYTLNSSTDLKNWKYESTLPFGTGGDNQVEMIEFVYLDGKYVAIHSDGKCALTSDLSTWKFPSSTIPGCGYYSTFCVSGNKIFCGDHNGVKVSSDGETWESVEGFTYVDCVYGANGNIFVDDIYGIHMSTDGGSTWVKKGYARNLRHCAYGNDEFYGVNVFRDIYKSTDGINWKSVPTSNNVSYESVVFGNGKFYFTDSNGKIYTLPESSNSEITFPELSQTRTITDGNSITIDISANRLEDAGDKTYTLDYEIKDCRVYAAFADPDNAKKTVIEMVEEEVTHYELVFTPPRVPSMSRAVNFDRSNSSESLLQYDICDTSTLSSQDYFSCEGLTKNNDKSRWYLPENGELKLSISKGFVGDMFIIANAETLNTGKTKLTANGKDVYCGLGANLFFVEGLNRESSSRLHFYDSEKSISVGDGVFFADAVGISAPVNAALYFGAKGSDAHTYEWLSNESGNIDLNTIKDGGPTIACQKVTTSAAEELKENANLRIYVIKFCEQENYVPKTNSSEKLNFNYDYIDACASSGDYVYRAGNEEELKNVLQTIAADIKEKWADHKPAQNVALEKAN